MGKITGFLRFFAFFVMLVCGANFAAYAADSGYNMCDVTYTSCNAGYYMSSCGDNRANWATMISATEPADSCIRCPDGYNCAGENNCPTEQKTEYTITLEKSANDNASYRVAGTVTGGDGFTDLSPNATTATDTAPVTFKCTAAQSVTLPTFNPTVASMTNPEYTFVGWSNTSGTYSSVTTFICDGDKKYYAINNTKMRFYKYDNDYRGIDTPVVVTGTVSTTTTGATVTNNTNYADIICYNGLGLAVDFTPNDTDKFTFDKWWQPYGYSGNQFNEKCSKSDYYAYTWYNATLHKNGGSGSLPAPSGTHSRNWGAFVSNPDDTSDSVLQCHYGATVENLSQGIKPYKQGYTFSGLATKSDATEPFNTATCDGQDFWAVYQEKMMGYQLNLPSLDTGVLTWDNYEDSNAYLSGMSLYCRPGYTVPLPTVTSGDTNYVVQGWFKVGNETTGTPVTEIQCTDNGDIVADDSYILRVTTTMEMQPYVTSRTGTSVPGTVTNISGAGATFNATTNTFSCIEGETITADFTPNDTNKYEFLGWTKFAYGTESGTPTFRENPKEFVCQHNNPVYPVVAGKLIVHKYATSDASYPVPGTITSNSDSIGLVLQDIVDRTDNKSVTVLCAPYHTISDADLIFMPVAPDTGFARNEDGTLDVQWSGGPETLYSLDAAKPACGGANNEVYVFAKKNVTLHKYTNAAYHTGADETKKCTYGLHISLDPLALGGSSYNEFDHWSTSDTDSSMDYAPDICGETDEYYAWIKHSIPIYQFDDVNYNSNHIITGTAKNGTWGGNGFIGIEPLNNESETVSCWLGQQFHIGTYTIDTTDDAMHDVEFASFATGAVTDGRATTVDADQDVTCGDNDTKYPLYVWAKTKMTINKNGGSVCFGLPGQSSYGYINYIENQMCSTDASSVQCDLASPENTYCPVYSCDNDCESYADGKMECYYGVNVTLPTPMTNSYPDSAKRFVGLGATPDAAQELSAVPCVPTTYYAVWDERNLGTFEMTGVNAELVHATDNGYNMLTSIGNTNKFYCSAGTQITLPDLQLATGDGEFKGWQVPSGAIVPAGAQTECSKNGTYKAIVTTKTKLYKYWNPDYQVNATIDLPEKYTLMGAERDNYIEYEPGTDYDTVTCMVGTTVSLGGAENVTINGALGDKLTFAGWSDNVYSDTAVTNKTYVVCGQNAYLVTTLKNGIQLTKGDSATGTIGDATGNGVATQHDTEQSKTVDCYFGAQVTLPTTANLTLASPYVTYGGNTTLAGEIRWRTSVDKTDVITTSMCGTPTGDTLEYIPFVYMNMTLHTDATGGDLVNTDTTSPFLTKITGTNDYTLRCLYGGPDVMRTLPSAAGLTRTEYKNPIGWATSANLDALTAQSNQVACIADNQDMYVKWTPIKYTIVLDDNGGTGGTGTAYQAYDDNWYNNVDVSLANCVIPTRPGYAFTGYYTSVNGGTQRIDQTCAMPSPNLFTENTTLYAQWRKNTYNVEYVCGDGTGLTKTDTDVLVGGEYYIQNNTNCNYAGHSFAGWVSSIGGATYQPDGLFALTDAQNVTMTAQWNACDADVNAPGTCGCDAKQYPNGTGCASCVVQCTGEYNLGSYDVCQSQTSAQCYRTCVPDDVPDATQVNTDGHVNAAGTDTCVATRCIAGKWLQNGQCDECPANGTCDGTATVQCQSGYAWNAGTNTCEFNGCEPGYYNDNNVCKPCESGYYCPGGVNAQRLSCAALGEWNMSDALATSSAQCYKECVSETLTGGTAVPINDKAFLNTQCEFKGITTDGHNCEIQGTTCIETTCKYTHEKVNGHCVPCNRPNAVTYLPTGNCMIQSCTNGYHPNGQQCDSDVKSCQAANAASAIQTWDERLKTYGVCKPTQCDTGYHMSANLCVADTEVCSLKHGTGTKEWNPVTNTWGECIAEKCDAGYTNDSAYTNEDATQCGRCSNAFGILGEEAVSTYSRECEIASCLYQGELYNLENNRCVPICETEGYSDYTGSRRWNPVTKKCERNCNPGYISW